MYRFLELSGKMSQLSSARDAVPIVGGTLLPLEGDTNPLRDWTENIDSANRTILQQNALLLYYAAYEK